MKPLAVSAIQYRLLFLRARGIVMSDTWNLVRIKNRNAFFATGLSWMVSVLKSRRQTSLALIILTGLVNRCEGCGKVIGIDERRFGESPIKTSKSIYEGAIAPWREKRKDARMERCAGKKCLEI